MNKSKEQVEDWLSKLERESWQLELLVSAFTIFLLIGALSAYGEFLTDLQYQYNPNDGVLSVIYIFLVLLKNSLLALIISLIVHLTLRGFWIGAIGLRSVQSSVDFSKLNYSKFFTEKLKKRVITLDQLVIKLDVISSVIFAFSFLVISVLIAIGMYFLFMAFLGVGLSSLINVSSGTLSTIFLWLSIVTIISVLISGLIYMIDFFTLGFFKKFDWFSKIYYPFYRFYNVITLSFLSRSIYYYLISKFSKRRIRILYLISLIVLSALVLFDFDQHQYYPEGDNDFLFSSNFYDNKRSSEDYINSISIESDFISKPFLQIFLRYDPKDNGLIANNCRDYIPLKDEGINWAFTIRRNGGNLQLSSSDYSQEDFESLLECQSSIYQIVVNDSVYSDLSFYFYEHPSKSQKGLLTTISTNDFEVGENVLSINKVRLDSIGNASISKFVKIPFWFHPN